MSSGNLTPTAVDGSRLMVWERRTQWWLTGFAVALLVGYAWLVLDTSLSPRGRMTIDVLLATMSTVSYGDRYPVTAEGRIVGATLMVAGIASLGVVTASIASVFLENLRTDEEVETMVGAIEEVAEEAAGRGDAGSGTGRAAGDQCPAGCVGARRAPLKTVSAAWTMLSDGVVTVAVPPVKSSLCQRDCARTPRAPGLRLVRTCISSSSRLAGP